MKERFVSLALLAAVIGIAPAFAQTSESAAGISKSDSMLADCMIQHQCKRVKKCAHKARRAVPVQKKVVTETTTTKTIEKPAVVQEPKQEVQEVQEVQQPAVVDTTQPVIIDRYERRHRSLIHLGLFPFSLFGGY
jgi:hypothetical protein